MEMGHQIIFVSVSLRNGSICALISLQPERESERAVPAKVYIPGRETGGGGDICWLEHEAALASRPQPWGAQPRQNQRL